jgi:chromosome segregation ATPase
MMQRSEEQTLAQGGVQHLLEDARRFLEIVRQMPEQAASIETLLRYVLQQPELEKKIVDLKAQLADYRDALTAAEQEKEVYKTRSEDVALQMAELIGKMEEESECFQLELNRLTRQRNELLSEIEELRSELKHRDELLVDFTGVRRKLQQILKALQGKKGDSSVQN